MRICSLNFAGLGYNDFNQAYVCIYDLSNNLVCKGKTYNGKINASLRCNRFYKVVAVRDNEKLTKTFLVDNSSNYTFIFSNSLFKKLNRNNIITFRLTDQNYDGLTISEGKIICKEQLI